MRKNDKYYQIQLQAIENFYKILMSKTDQHVSMKDAIISWFTEGYAEKFRQEYLRTHSTILN